MTGTSDEFANVRVYIQKIQKCMSKIKRAMFYPWHPPPEYSIPSVSEIIENYKPINIQEVARRLGHANVQETWNTYCHLYPREEERAVKVLNKIGTG